MDSLMIDFLNAYQIAYLDPGAIDKISCPNCDAKQLCLCYLVSDLSATDGKLKFWCNNCLKGLMPTRAKVPARAARILEGTEEFPNYEILVGEYPES
jgi:hypothetical protein